MKRRWRVALPLIMLLAVSSALPAQDTPATGGGGAATPFLRVSFASLGALEKLTTDLGFSIPGMPTVPEWKTSLETQAWIGEGAVATDKPIGWVYYASDSVPGLSSIPGIMVGGVQGVPIVQGKVTDGQIVQSGAKPVDGKPDTYDATTRILRRTPGYLFMQAPSGAGIQDLKDTVFSSDYQQAGNVAVVSLNLAALRTASPKTYSAFMANAAGPPGTEAAVGGFKAFAEKLDRVTFAVGQDEKNLQFKTWLTSPALFESKPPRQAERHAFPAGMFFQMHVVYPDADAGAWVERQIDGLPAGSFGAMPAEQQTKLKDLLKRAVHVGISGDAISFAYGLKNGKPVIYMVNQQSQMQDFGAEAKDISAAATALAKETGMPYEQSVANYDANGKTVTRWTISASNEKTYIDCLQADKTCWITISPDEGKYAEEFAALPVSGTSAILCAGAIDLGAISKTLPEGMLPAETTAMVKDSLAGQGITWTAQISEQGNYLYTNVQVPIRVAKVVPKVVGDVVGMMMGGMGGTPPGGPGGPGGPGSGGMMMPTTGPGGPGGGGMMVPMTMPATGPGGGN